MRHALHCTYHAYYTHRARSLCLLHLPYLLHKDTYYTHHTCHTYHTYYTYYTYYTYQEKFNRYPFDKETSGLWKRAVDKRRPSIAAPRAASRAISTSFVKRVGISVKVEPLDDAPVGGGTEEEHRLDYQQSRVSRQGTMSLSKKQRQLETWGPSWGHSQQVARQPVEYDT